MDVRITAKPDQLLLPLPEGASYLGFIFARAGQAVDVERASGFRYSQRAYLVQLRREGAGTALIDPIPLGSDLTALAPALAEPEWVL